MTGRFHPARQTEPIGPKTRKARNAIAVKFIDLKIIFKIIFKNYLSKFTWEHGYPSHLVILAVQNQEQ